MAERTDPKLAKTLIQTGVMTSDQLKECQAVAGDAGADVTALDVAIRRGYLDKTQVEAAQTQAQVEQTRTVALRRDSAVAKFALKQRFVSRDQIEACRREQLAREKSGDDATLLGMLLDAGAISDEQRSVIASAVGDSGYRRLGDFEILRRLGEGGMGAVYRARQISMDRVVALKILPARLATDEIFVKRFYREARACAKLDHPNVIRGLAVGEAEGHHYFAMEFVDGKSLRDVLDDEGQMPLWQATSIIADVAKGLGHAHDRDLIHRDIKPDNIMLTKDGVPKLADLGLAKETNSTRTAITESGTAMGTAYYMSPEQGRDAKRVDTRSDIYSLGATFYHLVTGRVPFEGDTFVEVARKHENDPLVPPRKLNPDIPERLSLIIEKMMNKKPAYRYKTAEEVVEALEQVHVGKPAAKKKQPVGEKPRVAAAAAARKPAGPRELWYVGLTGPGGKPITREFDLPTLERFIETGRVPLDAPVRKGKTGVFRTVDRYPQLARVLSMRRRRERDHVGQSQPYRDLYEQYDQRLARKALMRKIRAVVRVVVILGALAAIGWAFVTYVLPHLQGVIGGSSNAGQ